MALFVLMLAACGEDSATTNDTNKAKGKEDKTKSEEQVELTDASGAKIDLKNKPKTFGTLSSGELDILIALGADVTARPSSEDTLKSAKDAIEIGNPHQPNFEKLAKANPDMLVTGMAFKQHAANVEKQGTKIMYTQGNSIKDIQTTITNLGAIVGAEDKAKTINKDIDKKVESVEKSKGESVKTLLVYGAPGTFLAALPNSLSGDILAKSGGENIAKDFEKDEKFPQYASLSPERIIERNPEVVMLITHGDPSGVKESFEKEMKQNAAWKNLDAVKNDKVVILPAELFGSNPGTKITEAIDSMQGYLAEVK